MCAFFCSPSLFSASFSYFPLPLEAIGNQDFLASRIPVFNLQTSGGGSLAGEGSGFPGTAQSLGERPLREAEAWLRPLPWNCVCLTTHHFLSRCSFIGGSQWKLWRGSSLPHHPHQNWILASAKSLCLRTPHPPILFLDHPVLKLCLFSG